MHLFQVPSLLYLYVVKERKVFSNEEKLIRVLILLIKGTEGKCLRLDQSWYQLVHFPHETATVLLDKVIPIKASELSKAMVKLSTRIKKIANKLSMLCL